MTIYHKIVGGVIVASEEKENPGSAIGGDGNPIWRIEVADPLPSYDPALQRRTRNQVIEPNRVHLFWMVTNKTQQELDDEEADRKAGVLDSLLQADPSLKLTHSVIFDLLNMVRVLQGKAELTAAQYKTQVIEPRL